MKKKDIVYRKLIKQLEETFAKGYYFESAWLQYVLLEDRLVSILKSTGGHLDIKGKEIRMMGPKLDNIIIRYKKNTILKEHLDRDDLINRINKWKNIRNNLMHKMADGRMDIFEIETTIEELAKTGISLVRNTASAARRLKKI